MKSAGQTSPGNFLEGNANAAGEGMERAGSGKSFAWKGGRVRQVTPRARPPLRACPAVGAQRLAPPADHGHLDLEQTLRPHHVHGVPRPLSARCLLAGQ